jgi:hypothetical protein
MIRMSVSDQILDIVPVALTAGVAIGVLGAVSKIGKPARKIKAIRWW